MTPDVAMLLLKITAWCGIPFVLKPLLSRFSASARHLILTLVLIGTLTLPLMGSVPSDWAPTWLQIPVPAPIERASFPHRSEPSASGAIVQTKLAEAMADASHGEDLRQTTRPGRWSGDGAAVLRQYSRPRSSEATSAELPGASERLALSWSLPRLLLGIWLAGVAAMLLRTLRAISYTRRLVRHAAPIGNPRAAQALHQAFSRLSLPVSLRPELRQSSLSPVPFAWRGRLPVVVLPECWRDWDDERLQVVLVHELAHLGRRDALALAAGRAAVALWWFHPLVHALERWARNTCEEAADDAVLLSGSRASEYAEHLLAISRALARPFPSGVALMMSNSPDLKHRLLAILSADRPRRILSRRLAAGASLTALAFAVVLAGAQVVPVAQAQEPKVEVDVHIDKHHHGHHHDDSDYDSDSRGGHKDWHKAYKAHKTGRWDEAIAGFQAAAEAGYRPAVATYNAACGQSLAGRTDEALVTLRRAIELGLDDPEMIAEDSDLDPLRSDDRFQTLLDEAFELAGMRRDPIDHYRLRHAYEALEVLRETGSEDAGSWSKVGTRLLTLRQLGEASEALENAASYARETPSTALYNLACAKALDGRIDEALDALERSIGAGYDDAEHMRRDSDLASLRDEPEFERLATLAEDLDLNRFERALWRGHGKGKKHKHWGHHGSRQRYSVEAWAPAIRHFQALVEEQPDLGPAWFNLGYALHYSERFDEAIDALSQARELGYRPATATYNIACGYSMQNRVDDALAALEEAIELGYHSDLDHDSDLDNLRQDPRFRSLSLKLRLDRHS